MNNVGLTNQNYNSKQENNLSSSFNFRKELKSIFSNYIFIIFSFVILFLPFYATIISSIYGNNGIYNLISVGLSTSFITIFNQFLFLVSLSIIFVFKKNQIKFNEYQNKANYSYTLLCIISLISIALFIISSHIYIEFSTSYQNFRLSSSLGLKFVFSLSPSLFFNSFIYYFVINKYNMNKKLISWFIIFAFFLLNIVFIPICYFYLPFNDNNYIIGIGIGFSLSSFITFVIILFYKILIDHFHRYFIFNWLEFLSFNKKIINFATNFLLATFMKIFLIMAISLSVGLSNKKSPPELMIAKIVWYNSLFFCGWFADGLLYSIYYTTLMKYNSDTNEINNKKVWNFLMILTAIVTLIICVIFNFLAIGKITTWYTSHQNPPITNPLPDWPYKLNAQAINNYLWSPNGSYNLKLVSVVNGQITYQKSPHFSLMYTTFFHVLINSTKIMQIKKVQTNQKFNFKALIFNFLTIAFMMTFIVVFSLVPNTYVFNKTFGGIDAFSFSLMLVSFLMFSTTLFGYLKKENSTKFTSQRRRN